VGKFKEKWIRNGIVFLDNKILGPTGIGVLYAKMNA
jgi:selenocysteine lyase/cysteine desulfurase